MASALSRCQRCRPLLRLLPPSGSSRTAASRCMRGADIHTGSVRRRTSGRAAAEASSPRGAVLGDALAGSWPARGADQAPWHGPSAHALGDAAVVRSVRSAAVRGRASREDGLAIRSRGLGRGALVYRAKALSGERHLSVASCRSLISQIMYAFQYDTLQKQGTATQTSPLPNRASHPARRCGAASISPLRRAITRLARAGAAPRASGMGVEQEEEADRQPAVLEGREQEVGDDAGSLWRHVAEGGDAPRHEADELQDGPEDQADAGARQSQAAPHEPGRPALRVGSRGRGRRLGHRQLAVAVHDGGWAARGSCCWASQVLSGAAAAGRARAGARGAAAAGPGRRGC